MFDLLFGDFSLLNMGPSELFLPGSYQNNSQSRNRFHGQNASYGHHSPEIEHISSEEEDEGRVPEGASVNGRGLEVDPGSGQGKPQGLNSSGQGIVTYRNHGDLLRAKDQIWESFANKMLPPEESELMIQRLEKKADARTKRTYIEGEPTAAVDTAPTLHVGISFLPGADKPQVARFEQSAMTEGPPDQKNAMWRVNTAGALLRHFDVTEDLSVKETDNTHIILKKARERLQRRESIPTNLSQLTLRDRRPNVVTIDSKYVKIVDDLREGDWDLEATLIEVDGISLLNLMTNYRYLISRGGPNMSFDETRNLLDMMIEDARRLCVRSPVLFRMSTRARIMYSRNTRYGIDHGTMFRTISTSKGIQEIIRLSVSYFDALDPEGSNDTNQKFIRPRFLQMLTLLLSFLNNADLRDISGLLESTYKIKAERHHLEMLFLKVIPLMSINSKIFLEAMIPAFEGFPLQHPAQENSQGIIWDIFIQRILARGYILPGTVKDLGRDQKSWIVEWPEDGYKSTRVFKHLQYNGCPLRTINEINPIELHPEMSLNELTVHLVDGKQYTIDSRDLEKITRMDTGFYTVEEARPNGRKFDLEIEETHINSHLEEAILKSNFIIDELNKTLATPQKKLIKWPSGKRSAEVSMLNNFPGTGRMTKHVALLNQDILSIGFKVEGRKITKKDAWRTMASTIRHATELLNHLGRRAKDFEFRDRERQILMHELDMVKNLLNRADEQRHRIGDEEERHNDEPILQVIYPSGSGLAGTTTWHNYDVRYRDSVGLYLDAKASEVTGINWRSDNLVEVTLQGHNTKYIASPIGQGVINHDDEIQVGEVAALAGQYLIIAERPNDPNQPLIMTNYLRVSSTEDQIKSNRRRNRGTQGNTTTTLLFV